MATDTHQTSVLDAAEPFTPRKPKPVELPSAHDYALTATSLEARAEELAKLAKKNADEGYKREARAIQADADAINYHILPVFREQRELPLLSEEDLEREVASAIRVGVYRAFDGMDNPKTMPTAAAVNRRRDDLIKLIADRVTAFALDVAEEAFKQGLAAREQTPQSIAHRCVTELRVS